MDNYSDNKLLFTYYIISKKFCNFKIKILEGIP